MDYASNPTPYFIQAEELLEFYRCRRLPYLQRLGPQSEKLPTDDYLKQLRKERLLLRERIQQQHPGRVAASQGDPLTAEQFRQLQQAPQPIYQATLAGSLETDALSPPLSIISQPDLLVWQANEAHYIPVEIRTGKRVKPDYELMLAIHAYVLGQLQGTTPLQGMVILRDERWYGVNLRRRLAQVIVLLQELWAALQSAELPLVYMARSRCGLCSWRHHCRHLAVTRDPLTLLPGVTGSRYPLLRAAGISSVSDLASAKVRSLGALEGMGHKVAQQLIRQAQATLRQEAIWLHPPQLPQANVELYFDVEGDPQQDVAYLLGVLLVDRGSQQTHYHPCLALSPAEEGEAWQAFLSLVTRYPTAPIFHFHAFEVHTCQKLAERYGTPTPLLRSLVQRMVDLHDLVTQKVVLPVESYSLKNIARWLGFDWQQSDANGAQSIYWYAQWIETQDYQFMELSLTYNEDDCRATYLLKRWLEQRSVTPQIGSDPLGLPHALRSQSLAPP
ncbi:MAG: TM0106 family RecB-like putative nuclease [Cyanobacteriota bacterium]|nr:TM0106 family RecB-like putative nuclease [Cyanobacteriota bacterium]